MKKAVAPPAFTTIAEEAAVLTASAITWRERGQVGPPTASRLRRRAAIYERWSLVYQETQRALLAAAEALEAAPPAQATAQLPKKLSRGGPKNGPVLRVPVPPTMRRPPS